MTRERDGTRTLRRRAARPGGSLSAAILFTVIMATYDAGALAEPIYYVHMHGFGIWEQKFDTAAAACDHYRTRIQEAHDDVGATGGVTVITKLPREDIFPNLIMTDSCNVNWSWPYGSWNYSVGVLAGGCLPERRPKENVPPESFFAEPGDCEPKPCPVLPLTPLPPDDYCARSLEAGKGKDVYGACSIALTPAMKQQAQCLAKKIGALNIPYDGPESTVRTAAYQAHFREIWDKWRRLKRLMRNPSVAQACAARWKEIDDHKRWHGIKGEPAKQQSEHETGNAIDITTDTVTQLGLAVTGDSSYDIQAYIQDPSVNPPACNLLWGGRFSDYDPVHFQLLR